MKKLILLFLFVSLLFMVSCSADDESINEKRSKQYPVDLKFNSISNHQLINHLSVIEDIGFYYPASKWEKRGNGGVALVRWNDEIRAYDTACPYEWDQRVALPIKDYLFGVGEVECISCSSIYNMSTGKAISGKAKDARLDLVRYRVELKNMENTIYGQELIITN